MIFKKPPFADFVSFLKTAVQLGASVRLLFKPFFENIRRDKHVNKRPQSQQTQKRACDYRENARIITGKRPRKKQHRRAYNAYNQKTYRYWNIRALKFPRNLFKRRFIHRPRRYPIQDPCR